MALLSPILADLDYIKATGANLSTSLTNKDNVILTIAPAIEKSFTRECQVSFLPLIESRQFIYQKARWLNTQGWFTSLTSLVQDTITYESTDYFMEPLNGLSQNMPYNQIRLKQSVAGFTNDKDKPIVATANWSHITTMKTTGKALTENLTDIATTINLVAHGLPIGAFIKIGNEYLVVSDKTADILTVLRGVNGSTSAAHTIGDVIYRIFPLEDVQLAFSIMVVRTIARGSTGYSDLTGNPTDGYTYIKDMPDIVKHTIERRRFKL